MDPPRAELEGPGVAAGDTEAEPGRGFPGEESQRGPREAGSSFPLFALLWKKQKVEVSKKCTFMTKNWITNWIT